MRVVSNTLIRWGGSRAVASLILKIVVVLLLALATGIVRGDLGSALLTAYALALALAHHPELLILDEPTSGLDPVARLEVLDILRDFLVAEGRTVLFSTHITSDLERIADRLHIIGAGRTRFAGTLPDLVEQWAMARGPVSALTPETEAVLTGTRRNGAGAFAGLIRTADTAVFGPDVLIEPPSIDEAVVAMTRGPEPDRRSARSAAELAEKH